MTGSGPAARDHCLTLIYVRMGEPATCAAAARRGARLGARLPVRSATRVRPVRLPFALRKPMSGPLSRQPRKLMPTSAPGSNRPCAGLNAGVPHHAISGPATFGFPSVTHRLTLEHKSGA